jgi:RES domain
MEGESMASLAPFEGQVWRILPDRLVNTPAAPASAPEGRFHHSGQIAAYASLTAEGARIAIQRYLEDDFERMLIPMWLSAKLVADVRGNLSASVIWQDHRASALTPPTWELSDTSRRAGAQAMLYSSRSRPELTHVVVFQSTCLTFVGPITRIIANFKSESEANL